MLNPRRPLKGPAGSGAAGPALILAAAASVLLFPVGCGNDPQGPETWPDGATFYVGWPAEDDSALAFSPYGSILLFCNSSSGEPCVYAFDGVSDPLRQTSSAYNESCGPNGCWHPEVGGWEGRITYTATKDDSTTEIRTTQGGMNSPKVALDDSLLHLHPSWSPDADSMVFSTWQDGRWSLFKGAYDPGTYELSDIDTLYAPVDIHCLRASYSPTGEWILFQGGQTGDWDIWIIRPDGTEPEVVISGRSSDMHPCWGPDGDWFVFTSNRLGDFEIFLSPISGDTLVRVTEDPSADLFPAWNPEYDWIAFCSDRESGSDLDIFAIDVPSH